jgi:hypothetical protein
MSGLIGPENPRKDQRFVAGRQTIYRTHRIRRARKLANGVAPRIMPLPGRVSSSRGEFPRKLLKLHRCQNQRYESRPMRRNRKCYEEV